MIDRIFCFSKGSKFNLTFVFLALLQFILCSCSSNSNLSNGKSYKLVKSEEAKKNIRELKAGALLVRLQEKKRTIEALNKKGRYKLAKQVKEELDEENKKIVNAFVERYNFSEVYFFYSSDSEKIRDGKVNEINFLTENLEIDNSINCDKGNIFVAEFTEVEQSNDEFVDGYRFEDTESGPEKKKTYRGGPNLKIAALVLRDSNLIQLQRPFPYYVRTYRSKLFRKDPLRVVESLNEKLIGYSRQ